MSAKGYTSKTAIENYILKTIDPSFDLQIAEYIEGVEKVIEKLTGRNFIADSASGKRLYDGDGSPILLIDDAQEITKVEVNDVEVDSAYIYKYPANKTPKNKIVLSGAYFSSGKQNITITGKFGYSVSVPMDIKFVATVFVAGLLQPGQKTVRSETIGNYTVAYDNEKGWADFARAQDILKTYKKYTF
jgi:hypothetical protein